MKYYRIFLLFFALLLLLSCDEELDINQITFINCNECYTDEPVRADIKIKLTDPYKYGSDYMKIYIDIYEGNLEDNDLIRSIQTSVTETGTTLPVNKKYTFTATYIIDNKTYIAVNSATIKVKYNKDSCEDPCYYTTPRSINLKLKYIN